MPAGAAELTDSLIFCSGQGGKGNDVYLTLGVRQQTTLIDAQVTTYDRPQSPSACDEDRNGYREPPIPALGAPVDSKTITLENLSGYDQGNGGSLIVLQAPLSARELHEHYAQQLELSGWQEDVNTESAAAQFATYRFRNRGEAFV